MSGSCTAGGFHELLARSGKLREGARHKSSGMYGTSLCCGRGFFLVFFSVSISLSSSKAILPGGREMCLQISIVLKELCAEDPADETL